MSTLQPVPAPMATPQQDDKVKEECKENFVVIYKNLEGLNDKQSKIYDEHLPKFTHSFSSKSNV
uniref:ACB domain-containing protein n=1 Tax=Meloidogyne hapla TaxID=6305 RepID=A0A1I8BTV8_MELHA